MLSKSDALALVRASRTFVAAAVARRHLDVAYDMVGPELRSGLTRAQWTRGANPVVPFPAVGIADVGFAYSYPNDVALDLALVAKPGSDTIGKTFRIEFRRPRAAAPWRVVAWLPAGVSGASNVRSIARSEAEAARIEKETGPPLAAWWLAFPAGLLSCVLVLPVYLAVRSLARDAPRRARLPRRDFELEPVVGALDAARRCELARAVRERAAARAPDVCERRASASSTREVAARLAVERRRARASPRRRRGRRRARASAERVARRRSRPSRRAIGRRSSTRKP